MTHYHKVGHHIQVYNTQWAITDRSITHSGPSQTSLQHSGLSQTGLQHTWHSGPPQTSLQHTVGHHRHVYNTQWAITDRSITHSGPSQTGLQHTVGHHRQVYNTVGHHRQAYNTHDSGPSQTGLQHTVSHHRQTYNTLPHSGPSQTYKTHYHTMGHHRPTTHLTHYHIWPCWFLQSCHSLMMWLSAVFVYILRYQFLI